MSPHAHLCLSHISYILFYFKYKNKNIFDRSLTETQWSLRPVGVPNNSKKNPKKQQEKTLRHNKKKRL